MPSALPRMHNTRCRHCLSFCPAKWTSGRQEQKGAAARQFVLAPARLDRLNFLRAERMLRVAAAQGHCWGQCVVVQNAKIIAATFRPTATPGKHNRRYISVDGRDTGGEWAIAACQRAVPWKSGTRACPVSPLCLSLSLPPSLPPSLSLSLSLALSLSLCLSLSSLALSSLFELIGAVPLACAPAQPYPPF